jgi:hypothetical protein
MSVCEPETIDEAVTSSREKPEAVGKTAPAAAPARRSPRRYRWPLFGLLAVACAAGGVFLAGIAAAPTRIEPLPFGFQATQQGDHLLLTWDPAAAAVRGATRATLTIQDGPEKEDVELNLAVLPLGRLAYQPVFQNVGFRLRLANPAHRAVSEWAQIALRPE